VACRKGIFFLSLPFINSSNKTPSMSVPKNNS